MYHTLRSDKVEIVVETKIVEKKKIVEKNTFGRNNLVETKLLVGKEFWSKKSPSPPMHAIPLST